MFSNANEIAVRGVVCDRFLWIMTVIKWRRILFPLRLSISVSTYSCTFNTYIRTYKTLACFFFSLSCQTRNTPIHFISLERTSSFVRSDWMIRALSLFPRTMYVIFIFTLENVTRTSMTVCLLLKKRALFRSHRCSARCGTKTTLYVNIVWRSFRSLVKHTRVQYAICTNLHTCVLKWSSCNERDG